jgi:hypothetical protein
MMESPTLSSLTALEILATSLVMRLTLEELEWLERRLAEHTQEKRRKEAVEPLATLLAG